MRYLRGEYKLDVATADGGNAARAAPNVSSSSSCTCTAGSDSTFTDDELENLRANLKTGRPAARRRLLRQAGVRRGVPRVRRQPVPGREARSRSRPDDPLYGAEINGTAITTVRVRKERPDGKGAETEYRDARARISKESSSTAAGS